MTLEVQGLDNVQTSVIISPIYYRVAANHQSGNSPQLPFGPDRFQFPRLFPDSQQLHDHLLFIIRETMSTPPLSPLCVLEISTQYRVRVILEWTTTHSRPRRDLLLRREYRANEEGRRHHVAPCRKIKPVNVGCERHLGPPQIELRLSRGTQFGIADPRKKPE